TRLRLLLATDNYQLVLLSLPAAVPGEWVDDLDGLGRNLLAEDAFEDGTVDGFNLLHAVSSHKHFGAALRAKHPAAAGAVAEWGSAGSLRLGALHFAEFHVRTIDRRGRQYRSQRPTRGIVVGQGRGRILRLDISSHGFDHQTVLGPQ